MKKCSYPGCSDKCYSRNYCRPHYRLQMYGIPLGDTTTPQRVISYDEMTPEQRENNRKRIERTWTSIMGNKFPYNDSNYDMKEIEHELASKAISSLLAKERLPIPIRPDVEIELGDYGGRTGKTLTDWKYNQSARGCETRGKYNQRLKQAKSMPGAMTNKEFKDLVKQTGSKCHYCGIEGKMSLDHVVPLSKGGTHTKDNIVPACQPCNASKRDRTPEEWERDKERRKRKKVKT